MRRRYVITLVVVLVVVFLFISGLLARAFSVGGAEQAAITNLVTAEAHGDAPGVISLIHGCRASAACRARADSVSTALRRPGTVSIIEIQGTAGFSLVGSGSLARVAWLAGSSLPRVQCIRLRDVGTVLSGFTVQLRVVSKRIKSNADCPRHF